MWPPCDSTSASAFDCGRVHFLTFRFPLFCLIREGATKNAVQGLERIRQFIYVAIEMFVVLYCGALCSICNAILIKFSKLWFGVCEHGRHNRQSLPSKTNSLPFTEDIYFQKFSVRIFCVFLLIRKWNQEWRRRMNCILFDGYFHSMQWVCVHLLLGKYQEMSFCTAFYSFSSPFSDPKISNIRLGSHDTRGIDARKVFNIAMAFKWRLHNSYSNNDILISMTIIQVGL